LISFKGNVSIEHGIEANTSAPNVYWVPFVAKFPNYFRSNVSWCTALFKENLIINDFTRDTKVCYLDVTMAIEKDVV
jgi:hypothetical protein